MKKIRRRNRLIFIASPKMMTDREVRSVNRLREAVGFSPVATCTRKCLKCGEHFLSQGLRLCPCCQRHRVGMVCKTDGTAYDLT